MTRFYQFSAGKSYVSETCKVGTNVSVGSIRGNPPTVHIGDGVRIGDDVRILLDGKLIIEDGVTLHHHVTILGSGDCTIKKGTWIAQYTALDCEGGLEIGEDCCIGVNCQIWSHVCRVPQLPRIRFHAIKKTTLKNRVWLMGGLITVSPGVTIENDCVILSNSVVSHDTIPNKVYSGIPARIMEQYDSPYV